MEPVETVVARLLKTLKGKVVSHEEIFELATDASSDSAYLDRILEALKKEGIKVILNGAMYPTRAADYVAAKTGAKVIVISTDVGGIDGTDTYRKLIDTILQKMVDAVK